MTGSVFSFTPRAEAVAVPVQQCGGESFFTDTSTTGAGRSVVILTPNGDDFSLLPAEAIDLARALLASVAYIEADRGVPTLGGAA